MTKEVKTLLKDHNTAFRSGDRALYSTARANLKKGIREAKAAYKRKIEDHFTNNDPRQVWQGIQHITNYKTSNCTIVNSDTSLAEELDCIFACYEAKAAETVKKTASATNSHVLTVQEHDVSVSVLNPRKGAGPDGVTRRMLRLCADQLSEVFTKIFNLSLSKYRILPELCQSSHCLKRPLSAASRTTIQYTDHLHWSL